MPFSFTLPIGVPSSLKMKWKHLGKSCEASTLYYIKVYLVPPTGDTSMLQEDIAKLSLTKKVYLDVLQHEECIKEHNALVINEQIMKCMCFFQGFVDIKAKLNKKYYYPGDTATVSIHANNSFNLLDINAIRVTIHHVFEIVLSILLKIQAKN